MSRSTPAQSRRIARAPHTALCAFVVLLTLSLAGCGAVTERILAWYVTRTLDGYLDFTSEQKRDARVRVDDTLLLLRRTEIPAWISLLREVRQGLHEGLSEDGIARLQRHYDSRLDTGVTLLAPRFAPILVQLAPEQLDHFAARMREDVDAHYEERDLLPAKRQAAIEKRVLDLVSDLAGDLTDAQASALAAIVRSVPDERPAQYRAAYNNIARFRAFMAHGPDVVQIESELRFLWDHRYDDLGPGREKAARRVEQRKVFLAVLQLLDGEQRAHVEEELTERIRLLKRFVLPS